MSDVKWIKITTDIFDDEKILLIESLPDADAIIVIWFKLLCLAGKQNNSGVFVMNNQIAYTDKMLATIFRRKEATVTMALQTFEQFGMVEIVDGVITIPNWGKHQTLDKIEERNEYMRNYMSEYREKQKKLTRKTNSKVNSKVNVNSLEEDKDIEVDKEEKDIEKEVVEYNTTVITDALHSYEKLIGLVTPAVTDGISFFVNEGMEPELIIRIIEYACEQGKRTWQYINAALLGNLNANIKTLEAYNRVQADRAEQRQKVQTSEKKGSKSKFNNYTDTNQTTLTAEQIIADMLAESEENK